MKWYGTTNDPQRLVGDDYVPMAQAYWGATPLPDEATIVGGYSDRHRAGALIMLSNGRYVCGNAGRISNVPQYSM